MTFLFKDRIRLFELVHGPNFHDPLVKRYVMNVFANVRPLRECEFATREIGCTNSEIKQFIVRYTRDIKPHYKIEFKGKEYSIIRIVKDIGKNYTITLVARVNAM
ncbi:phage head closure protein [Aliicoccus persicus]|uniref:Phage head-tail adaptor, putative, SPP1 family n=1 Tax=Aliicoccus persicus TaxID=930138 RepID=A0A662Z6Q5_9STAP|nr:phage head closure protein [Aliicoccus persicus]SEW01057.1 phage head-tail adaptor, putative, SPP1 family [Aliicoccus persicus]